MRYTAPRPLLLVLLALLYEMHCTGAVFTPRITDAPTPQPIRSYNRSVLYEVAAAGYDTPYLFADLHGDTRYELGYSYGHLLAAESVDAYTLLLNHVVPDPLEQSILGAFLDWQWGDYLSRQLPAEYREELRGVGDALAEHGFANGTTIITRGLVLSSFPGDVESNIEWLLINEARPRGISDGRARDILRRAAAAYKRGCSHFGVWGNRTKDGTLYSGRNLDWNADTGISKHKLIAVYHPPEAGKRSHAALGFAGLYGALTGMSADGVTVHEAGNDNKLETMEGFAWALRLRWIMENSGTLEEARGLWERSNNTLGMNHAVGSAKDNRLVEMETKAWYTAYFNDNDPRESLTWKDGKVYGKPLSDAVWRTNHGFDPTWLSTAIYDAPSNSSNARYHLLHDTIVLYDTIGDAEAVNITAVPANKGGMSFTTCRPQHGTNILSATYHGTSTMYVAFENGHGSTHLPAACNPYVRFNLSGWW